MRFKNIPGLLPALQYSDLATTKIWQMHINKITKYQLNIVIANAKIKNKDSKIEDEVQYAIKYVCDAVYEGLIQPTRITEYKSAKQECITTSALVCGLLKLKEIYRKALLFALETGVSLNEVCSIERTAAKDISRKSQLAKEVFASCVISVKTSSLFWEPNEEKEHVEIVNLEQAVYEAFGYTYELLALKYENIIYDEWFEYLAS